ncbi:MAG: hypothetical protein B0D92_02200 [Spirochaeta sp. LUC14_002_19_P3]|nr:MAG: hypothetical protein B0D92_02200 [Spirochaeta sp. LUC14_002_19_P3]
MTTTEEKNTAMTVTLTILGVLSIALFSGLLLMQKQHGKDVNLGTALSFRQNDAAADNFDPISWARESADYPPLEEAVTESTESTELVMLDEEGAIPIVEPVQPPEETPPTEEIKQPPEETPPTEEIKQPVQSVAKPVQSVAKQAPKQAETPLAGNTAAKVPLNQPVVYSEPVVKIPAEAFKTVQESAYWVQVFSSADQSSAEEIREKFSVLGFPSTIQIKKINGTLRYRVRLGAFARRSEAEYHATEARKIAGFETSYVTIAAITRQVPTGS